MKKHRKIFNDQERVTIIQFANEHGVAKASIEYNISSSIIYKWQRELVNNKDSNQINELQTLKLKMRQLERENASLKEIVADQTLAIKIKDTILKKKILKDQS